MIQRIQSLWLLLASAGALLSLKLPFYRGQKIGTTENTSLSGHDSILLIILTTAVAVLSLIIIFLFKDRKMQFKLSLVAILLQVLLIFNYFRETNGFDANNSGLTIESMLQPAILLLLFLASKHIKKDQRIIEESDRIR